MRTTGNSAVQGMRLTDGIATAEITSVLSRGCTAGTRAPKVTDDREASEAVRGLL